MLTGSRQDAQGGYRPDIDGLRAISVLMVLAYHTQSTLLPGGFVGVDIFFVVSGFVITSMIVREQASGTFSLVGFYERRVRRLFPAMAVMLTGVAAVSAIYVLPRVLEKAAGSLSAQVLLLSNMYFWRYLGNYFEVAPEQQPLLHTWSLSVEEQFYLFFPFLMLLLARSRTGSRVAVLLVIGAVSLSASILAVGVAPTLGFYAMPTRVWELVLGALTALLAHRIPAGPAMRLLAGLAGLCAIGYAAMWFNGSTPFPGWHALVPAIGAVLVIGAGTTRGGSGAGRFESVVGTTLSWRPLVFVGLVSYSLYLWHWPIFVLARHHILQRPLSGGEEVLAWVLSFALAILSWRFVERPFRGAGALLSRRGLFAVAGAVSLVLLGAGVAVERSGGWPQRFPGLSGFAVVAAPRPADWPDAVDGRCFLEDPGNWDAETCRLTREGGVPALLWGDSYAMHFADGIRRAAGQLPLTIYQYTSPSCPAVFDFRSFRRPVCDEIADRLPAIVERLGVRVVVMSANWFIYVHRGLMGPDLIGETVARLQAMGVTVVLVGQSPLFPFAYPDEYRYGQDPAGNRDVLSTTSVVEPAFHASIQAQAGSAMFFDPVPVLCEGTDCDYFRDGRYLLADTGHLTDTGSELVMRALFAELGAEILAVTDGSPHLDRE